MEYIEFSAKTVNDAITAACQHFTVASDSLDYEVIEEGSSGFLGIGAKDAVIEAKVKSSVTDTAKIFLNDVFHAMNMTVVINVEYKEEEKELQRHNKAFYRRSRWKMFSIVVIACPVPTRKVNGSPLPRCSVC